MRIALLSVLVLVGCSDDDGDGSLPSDDAVASCVYELTTADGKVATSTLWFNSLDQVIQIDGSPDDPEGSQPSRTFVHYDAQGRVIAQESPYATFKWTYSADHIDRTGDGGPMVMSLVDGRITHIESPTDKPAEQRSTTDYTYDAAGRIWTFGVNRYRDAEPPEMWTSQYTYDSQGRIVSVIGDGEQTTLRYTESAAQLVIDFEGGGVFTGEHWVFNFDAEHRLSSTERSIGGPTMPFITTYAYSEGRIEQSIRGTKTVATGRCDPPKAPRLAPELPLPIQWQAYYTRLTDITEDYSRLLF